MKLSWFMIWAGTLFWNPVTADCNVTSQIVTCEEFGKNLCAIPINLCQNVTKLSLKNNKITLNDSDRKVLQRLTNLTELYLNENVITVLPNNSFCNLTKLTILDISNNHIITVHQAAFAGLNQLSKLNLLHNNITQLDSDVFTSLKCLTVLNLQDNLLKSLHIKTSFKLITVILAGNPWNCSCGLLDLQKWLTTSNVTMENENNTVCAYPNTQKIISIKTAVIQTTDCDLKKDSLETTVTSTSANKLKSIAFLTSLASSNVTSGNGTRVELPLLGKSWTFLVGVLGFVLSTTLLIFTAIKCPTWYRHLISYNHRRLEENDPEMFEQEFSADTNSFPTVSGTNNEHSIVIFEKIHAFVPEEDGFIEDKYIDTHGITEES
ncbi:leucine-rich repeat-containing protein 19 isoform X1 [Struthio camelus]|uniref:leucine-rich repeat-containing protein 19 isoform X1 n=1 Tax=Struthio camelus TaxID=8801 RepID=UPI003603FC8B